jgi:hypothetical protein
VIAKDAHIILRTKKLALAHSAMFVMAKILTLEEELPIH